MSKNIELKENFSQVCVWQATLVEKGQEQDFEKFIFDTLNSRVQFLEVIFTSPDFENGFPVEGTGGRSDVFFALHEDDIGKFAVSRLFYGFRWIEDVYLNGHGNLYPERVADYKTW